MPKTLLLADDSVTIQKVVGISFANEDVTLVTVDNGDDALARARELQPDIVLADVVMPGMNGYEVCEAIKADPELHATPVLLLTGTFEAFDEARASRAGADGHITKPFEAQALVDEVNRRLAALPAPGSPVSMAAEPQAAAIEDFDFFEEETTAPSSLSGPAADPQPPTAATMLMDAALASPEPLDAALELDPGVESEDAFGFDAPEAVYEELAVSTTTSLPEEPQPTLQSLPPLVPEASLPSNSSGNLPSPSSAAIDPESDATRVVFGEPEEATGPLSLDGDEPTASGFDLGGDDPLADISLGDLSGESVLDPSGARDYDVSSSDLGDLLSVEPDPASFGTAPELFPAETASAEMPDLVADAVPAPAPGFEAGSAAVPETTPFPDVRADDPFEAPVEGLPPTAKAEASELAPELRAQLHDTLEKIAWEAFGDVAERLVKDALQRVEQVAWEVIPQMAEALIQEEIRKLKGER